VPIPCITCICDHKNNSVFRIRGTYANCTTYLTYIAYFLGFHSPSFLFFFISKSLHNCSLLSLVWTRLRPAESLENPPHNYTSPSSTVEIQLHVSALYVGHPQVVLWLTEQLYKMCGLFFETIGGNEISLFLYWVSWPRAVRSGLSLVVYVHMSWWVSILMLRICYN